MEKLKVTTNKILVCGSRTYGTIPNTHPPEPDHPAINRLGTVLDGLYATYGPFTLIHGAAQGADTLAYEWALNTDCSVVGFPADWATHGKSAGPIRNKAMLDFGPDLVVAFVDKPLHESRGTNNMVTIARQAGVRTFVIENFDGNLNKQSYTAGILDT
jgi:hypothetical protein